MDVDPLVGAEERTVRAARRFGSIGLAITVAWLLLVPALPVWAGFPPAELAVPLFALYLVGLGLHLWRIREHVTSLGRRASPWFTLVATSVGLAITLLGLATGFTGYIWALVGGVMLGDVVGGLRAPRIAAWVLAATAVVLAAGYPISASAMADIPISPWFPTAVAAWFVATMWTLDVERLWWLKAVTDMDGSRRAAADLAAARERLRLADDLHDILGHALEVVAFKSELATRLLAAEGSLAGPSSVAEGSLAGPSGVAEGSLAGPSGVAEGSLAGPSGVGGVDRARAEMEEVQRVARSSLAEVRALARDTRPTDLAVELAGARAVFGSAGVSLTVRGDPDAVVPAARNVLGRVLREAMTNVLRHAEPSRCAITIESRGGSAVLRVENDGALPAGNGDGTGLAALSRYLDEHAGRLDAGPGPDGTFRLSAVLPDAAR